MKKSSQQKQRRTLVTLTDHMSDDDVFLAFIDDVASPEDADVWLEDEGLEELTLLGFVFRTRRNHLDSTIFENHACFPPIEMEHNTRPQTRNHVTASSR